MSRVVLTSLLLEVVLVVVSAQLGLTTGDVTSSDDVTAVNDVTKSMLLSAAHSDGSIRAFTGAWVELTATINPGIDYDGIFQWVVDGVSCDSNICSDVTTTPKLSTLRFTVNNRSNGTWTCLYVGNHSEATVESNAMPVVEVTVEGDQEPSGVEWGVPNCQIAVRCSVPDKLTYSYLGSFKWLLDGNVIVSSSGVGYNKHNKIVMFQIEEQEEGDERSSTISTVFTELLDESNLWCQAQYGNKYSEGEGVTTVEEVITTPRTTLHLITITSDVPEVTITPQTSAYVTFVAITPSTPTTKLENCDLMISVRLNKTTERLEQGVRTTETYIIQYDPESHQYIGSKNDLSVKECLAEYSVLTGHSTRHAHNISVILLGESVAAQTPLLMTLGRKAMATVHFTARNISEVTVEWQRRDANDYRWQSLSNSTAFRSTMTDEVMRGVMSTSLIVENVTEALVAGVWKTTELTVLIFDRHSEETYIRFTPDMTPLQHCFSICGWIKKRLPGTSPAWFTYVAAQTVNGDSIIAIGDAAYYVWLGALHLDHSDGFPVRTDTWHHHCTTWSNQTRKLKVYLNGQLVALSDIATLAIPTGGEIVIGNVGRNNENQFGGELTKVNIFAKELNKVEVQQIWQAGIGSDIEGNSFYKRYITWEDILGKERVGSIVQVNETNNTTAGLPILQFPLYPNSASIIMTTPDMTPFEHAITICGWVRRFSESSSDWRVWFTYLAARDVLVDQVFTLTDDGSWGSMFRSNRNTAQMFATQQDVWFHQCFTWSNVSRKFRMYYNSELMGTEDVSGRMREFPTNGDRIVLGNCVFGLEDHCNAPFGGMLTKVNMFAKELKWSDIREIFEAGRDTDIENKHDFKRHISWDDFLRAERNGSIVEHVMEVQVKEKTTDYRAVLTIANKQQITELIPSRKVEGDSDSRVVYVFEYRNAELSATIYVDLRATNAVLVHKASGRATDVTLPSSNSPAIKLTHQFNNVAATDTGQYFFRVTLLDGRVVDSEALEIRVKQQCRPPTPPPNTELIRENVPGSEDYQFRVQCQEENQVFLFETETRIICNTTTGTYTSQRRLTPCTVA